MTKWKILCPQFTADIKVLTLSFLNFNKCFSSPNEKWWKVYTYKNWWVFFNVSHVYVFLWKHFVSVSSNRQSVAWLSCDTDSRISLYRLTYYYICSKRCMKPSVAFHNFTCLFACNLTLYKVSSYNQWCVNKARNQHHPYQRRGKASIRVFVLCADRKIMQCTDSWLAVNNL